MNQQPWKTYAFSYPFDGSEWVFEIKAASPEDAQQRVRQLYRAKLDGELIAKIATPTWLGHWIGGIARFLGL